MLFHAIAFVTLTSGCPTRPALEITDVHLIDVATGLIRRNATITIDGGRICRISSANVGGEAAAQRIAGRGRYAVPGLRWPARDAGEAARLIGHGVTYTVSAPEGSSGNLHRTLTRLVQHGRTNLAALQSVTLPDRDETSKGLLEPGAEATLILLEANPLDDIANIRSVSLVLLRGQPLGLIELARARAGRREGRSISRRAAVSAGKTITLVGLLTTEWVVASGF